MAKFSLQPTRSQALFVAVGAALLMIIATVVLIVHGHFQWFFVAWYLVCAFIIAKAVLRARATRP